MVESTQHAYPDNTPEHDTRGDSEATNEQPHAPPMGHTVVRPSQVPRGGGWALTGFIVGGLIFALLIVLYFVSTALKSNGEEEHNPRRMQETGHTQPQ